MKTFLSIFLFFIFYFSTIIQAQEKITFKAGDDINIRSYQKGDEDKIVDFLNLCYGNWGNLQKWNYFYKFQPLFTNFDATIAETKCEIIGYGGMHSRHLTMFGEKMRVVLMGDGAVHPEFRGRRLHSKLLGERFRKADDRDTALCFGWVLKNSDAYKSDIRAGFVEVKQFPTYIRILNHSNVLKAGLTDLLAKNNRLRTALLSLEYQIYFQTNKMGFSLSELLNIADDLPQVGIGIFLDEDSINYVYNFRSIGTLQRLAILSYLLVLRKIKVSFPSFKAFLKFIKKAVSIAKSF